MMRFFVFEESLPLLLNRLFRKSHWAVGLNLLLTHFPNIFFLLVAGHQHVKACIVEQFSIVTV